MIVLSFYKSQGFFTQPAMGYFLIIQIVTDFMQNSAPQVRHPVINSHDPRCAQHLSDQVVL